MTFEEAKAQLIREDAERHEQWAKEREERLAKGELDGLDEVFQKLDNRDAWLKAHPFSARAEHLWWHVKRSFRRLLWEHIWSDNARNFYQRGHRGWSDCDWWNINSYLERVIPEMVRKLAKDDHGYPIDMYDENGKSMVYEETVKDGTTRWNHALNMHEDEDPDPRIQLWADTLERIAQGFEAMNVLSEFGWRHEGEAEHELERIWHEGFMLMYYNWAGLWD